METRRDCMRVGILLLYLTIAAISFTHCDARRSMGLFKGHPRNSIIKHTKKLNVMDLILDQLADSSNTQPYVSSPFTLPPFDSLAPIPLPEITPPYCLYPPNTPQAPSTTIPTPTGYTLSPPPPFYYLPPILPTLSPPPSPTGEVPSPTGEVPSPTGVLPSPTGEVPSPTGVLPSPTGAVPSPTGVVPSPTGEVPSPTGEVPSPPESYPTPNPPEIVPSPPEFVPSPTTYIPSPPGPILSPPYYEPSPPSFVPSPPSYVPSPTGFLPSPPVFLPPVVYPPPTVPPSPKMSPSIALWCVAKPSVPDPIIQEAMNYACGSGADCDSILPSGACFQPNTLFAHASYAFNSYWQRTKVAGGTCEFGGTAILVTVDPSYDGCHFVYY